LSELEHRSAQPSGLIERTCREKERGTEGLPQSSYATSNNMNCLINYILYSRERNDTDKHNSYVLCISKLTDP